MGATSLMPSPGALIRRFILIMGLVGFACLLVACGGSGAGKEDGAQAGSTGTAVVPPLATPTVPPATTPTVPPTVAPAAPVYLALSLLDANAGDVTPSPTIPVGGSLTLRIVATDAAGRLLPNTLINVTAPAVAVLVPESGTALTDLAGVARITVIGNVPGAGELTASAIIGGEARTRSTPLAVTSGVARSGLALSVLDAGGANVTQSPRVAVGSQLTLKIVATDLRGAPVPNALVTVTAPPVAVLLPAVGTVLTDALGVARIQVEGLAEGAGVLEVKAAVDATVQTAALALAVTSSSTTPQAPEALVVGYVGASIHTLKISGTTRESTSTLTFKVVNQAGQPVPNQRVDFAPSLTTGGLAVSPLFAITSAEGTVTTNVRAGVIPTPVRVKATATMQNTGIESFAQSAQLSISSGQPSQRFFSLSAETLNIDGCDFDGAQTAITARAGDQFGNPVPDGTAVNFVAEGGRIGVGSLGSCETTNGVCSVLLESQEYRPKGYRPGFERNNCRISVLGYAVGEESFIDVDNNGIRDSSAGTKEEYEDLPDAFLNIEPLERTPVAAPESFKSRSELTTELVGDRLIPFQNGKEPEADEVWGAAHVRRLLEVVFSSRQVVATFTPSPISFAGCTSTQTGVTRTATVSLADVNGNPLAAGSSVTIEGTGATAGSPFPSSVPNTSSPGGTDHQFILTADPAHCVGGASAGAKGSARVLVKPIGGAERAFTVDILY